MAAGDWLVQDGTVFYLNASSGHYRPTVANMHLFAAIHQRYWGGLLKFPPRKNGVGPLSEHDPMLISNL